MNDTGKLRIDKWLWFARVVKTRSAATALCTDGSVRLNGTRVDHAHKAVRVGDVVTVAVGDRIKVLKIVSLAERRGPYAEAQHIYEDLSPEPPRFDLPSPVAAREAGSGRPTKADRRDLDRLRRGED
ncbi:MAG: RNA-binding S4 domain-containing protein [Phreatobacter sp.]|uniref:RNA-binding S4 domain-containing protein n=1 Tax=Phreatobacter sp. TaxID=1966341 RepID=UPI002733F900|nr:RNA-binding S4 domain-containing protein [Phreatobacter sp.]MDP2801795.1 RNA-binding S4 domain-containing protein [Phreatobacter sp.]